MIRIKGDEQLNEGMLTIISQLPPIVKDGLNNFITKEDQMRNFRQQVFYAVSENFEFSMDQLHAYALVELLALGININPPYFNPSKIAPNELAQQKANSFLSSYLMNQYVQRLNQIGLNSDLIDEVTVNAGDLYLTQINRLQYNFNHHFNVANYLGELKNRVGLLYEILVKLATSFNKQQRQETIDLLTQIGNELGIINYLQLEQEIFDQPQKFTDQILTGSYPLAFLFAEKEDSSWFKDFFSQKHKPTPEQFEELRQHCYKYGYNSADDIISDMLKQVKIDCQVLPDNSVKEKLLKLITNLETN